jgi:hypothetical protein
VCRYLAWPARRGLSAMSGADDVTITDLEA